jgi:replicative DNA helicase
MTDKLPPCDVAAERAVLSACLLSPECLATVRDIIRPEQLFDTTSRMVLESLYSLDDTGSRVDAVTLASTMNASGKLKQIGGASVLVELFNASPDIAHVTEHAAIVESKHRLRSIIDVCRTHLVAAYGEVSNVDDYCAKVESDILRATDPGTRADSPQTLKEIIEVELPNITDRQSGKKVEDTKKVKTRIYELDQFLRGGLTNNLHIIAGRPGQGKSVLANTLCLANAAHGRSSVLFSLEMPKDQLAMRLLSSASLVPFDVIESEKMHPEQWDSVLSAAEFLADLPMSIQHRPGAHVSQIRATFRREFTRLKRMFGVEPGICAIDYAQLVGGDRAKGASRDEEVGSISRACMRLPHDFNCPCLLLAQLNREVERRPNKRPQLSDLRESGSLEQDAYSVMFLYRDAHYNEACEDKEAADVIFAKNRNGRTGTVSIRFCGPTLRFYSQLSQVSEAADEIGDSLFD